MSAERRVKNLCSQITIGMSVSELAGFGMEHGLSPAPKIESGDVFMVEGKSYGRYGCKIQLQSGRVVKSEYNFLD